MKELIKVDRNGTKYWRQEVSCWRCGGHGTYFIGTHNGQLIPARPDAGVCWRCGGTGKELEIIKEYTPEHLAKLEAQRAKRAEKKMAEERAKAHEINLKFFSRNGFDQEGNIWVILGDTYPIREELKALGCTFDGFLGWHSDHELSGYPQLKLTADQICLQSETGIYHGWNSAEAFRLVSEAQEAIKEPEPESNYVGSVGDRIEIRATLKRSISYEINTDWMTQHKMIYIFTDESGNQLTWNTTAYADADDGDHVILKGTIKAHKEYKGIKQTELQRCKVTKEVK